MRRFIVQMITLAGLGACLASCAVQWFVIPIGAEPLSTSPATIHVAEPRVTIVFRLLTVAVLAALVILWALGKAGSAGLVVASLWLAALLTYPYIVMNWQPSVAGDAAWLEGQHRNLVWSGGDLALSVGYRIDGELDRVSLIQPPRSVNPIEMSEWQPSELSLARLPNLVDRLGYSNKFFEFIRLGWVGAVAGILLLLTAIGAPRGYLDIGRLVRMTAVFSAAAFVLGILGVAWSFATAAELATAADCTARGEYQGALDAMQRAEKKLPALGEDTSYIAQTGLLEDALGRNTRAAQLYRATLDELDGKRQQSDGVYARLVADPETSSPIRREACRAVLRSAIDALNAGRTNAAVELLEKVLAIEPCNLKANYALQFAYLRCGRYAAVPQLAARMQAVYRYFQFPSKQAAVSACYQNALVADAALGNTTFAIAHARKVINP
ncbi:MAG: hypothetical protein K8T25_21395 [Planctomycetia bacterium]|nr:hypothetical protein [Planctomycetia bacterium]